MYLPFLSQWNLRHIKEWLNWPRFCRHHHLYFLKAKLFYILVKISLGLFLRVTLAIQYIPRNMHTFFVVLCFVVVMQSFIMSSREVFIHIHQGCFAGTGAIVRLPQCQWSKPDGYGEISQCITTTKHSKAKTVCIFLGIYCKSELLQILSHFSLLGARSWS